MTTTATSAAMLADTAVCHRKVVTRWRPLSDATLPYLRIQCSVDLPAASPAAAPEKSFSTVSVL